MSAFLCSICGEARNLRRHPSNHPTIGAHYSCRLQTERSLACLSRNLRDVGMLQHAWELAADYGISNSWEPGGGKEAPAESWSMVREKWVSRYGRKRK